MFKLFPSGDVKRRVILRRLFMAAGTYAVWSVIGLSYVATGDSLIDKTGALLMIAGAVLTNLYFYAMIRSGASLRFKDPSMTLAQLIVAMSWLLALMLARTDARGLLIVGDVMILMFGVFGLRRRELAIAASFAFFGYVALVLIDLLVFPYRFVLLDEVLRITVLAAMLGWCVFFGGEVSALRRKLRRRNHELGGALRELGKLASHDDLTKAYNRRFIMDTMRHEKSRADRGRQTFSVCILDIDHFKTINDRYGHLAGDRVLMAFSERIRGTLRGMDMIDNYRRQPSAFGRYGGEEFILVLPETQLAGALRCAERIRGVTEADAFDEVFRITVSAGVSQYRPGESVEDMLQRADAALYEAKSRGRNRVMAEDHDATSEYEMAVGDSTVTNVVVGPFGQSRNRTQPGRRFDPS